MGSKISPKDLEKFYSNVDKVCAEIFDVGTIFIDIDPDAFSAEEDQKTPEEDMIILG